MTPRRQRFHANDYASVIERQMGKCACGCGESLGTDARDWHWEHTVPLWAGGKDNLSNLTAMLKKHHASKTAREAAERAKADRIKASDGHRRRNMNATERDLKKRLEAKL